MTDNVIQQMFEGGHTTNTFTDQPVDVELIHQVYNDLRWAPTAMNNQPLRLTVVESAEQRAKLVEQLAPGNQAKTQAAPLSIVVAVDPRWHEHLPVLAPSREGAREKFEEMAEMRSSMAQLNGTLQAGYLILALRAHGLQVGPMTGLNAEGVDEVFHAQNGWKTLMVLNVGHSANPDDAEAQRPRAGRLDFDQAAQVL